jgi:LuxR family transcriptional regulator, maltose regulon positive regulatory protein
MDLGMNQQAQESNSPNTWMWVGKLAPPETRLEAVPRHNLLYKLRHHLVRPLTLVVSAPGFGKTTLLAQFRSELLLDKDHLPVAWLSLDEADADLRARKGFLLRQARRSSAAPVVCRSGREGHSRRCSPPQACL